MNEAKRKELHGQLAALHNQSKGIVLSYRKHRKHGLSHDQALIELRHNVDPTLLPRGGWQTIETYLKSTVEPEAGRLAAKLFYTFFNLDPSSFK